MNTFVLIGLFKGQFYLANMINHNLASKMSAYQFIKDFYYSLFDILQTTVACAFYMALDQDVSLNTEKFVRDNSAETQYYDPNNWQ
jgi:hypothetical protein